MEYIYENITVSPCLIVIQSEILASDMTDKSVEGCNWDEVTQVLEVLFTNTLSSSDEDILDGIVANRIPASSSDCCSPETPSVYVDRGDPADWDFITVDFISDYNWHELDLSSIVPEGTKAVHLCALIRDDAVGSYIEFRKKGTLNAINRFLTQTQTADVWVTDEGIVSCDANRKIEYRTSNTTFTVINLTVKGWFI